MISKFSNLFKKSDLDEKNNFRRQVLAVLRSKFPALEFSEGESFEVINIGETKLGLSNLRSKFLLTAQTAQDLEDLAEEQFGHLALTLASVENLDKSGNSWAEVKEKIVLQIMPAHYAESYAALSFPLAEDTVIGCVVDDEKTYRYVSEANAKEWGVSKEEIYETGGENLKKRCNELKMNVIPPPTAMVLIQTMDSFDAARILLEDLRSFIAEQIGSPFYFGIPNRDFLVCFSSAASEESQRNMRAQIAADYEERPYPLSPRLFVVDGRNEIKQLEISEPATPNQKAHLN